MSNRAFYAVHTGRTTGIFNTWAECEKSIKDFPNAKFKKFTNKNDAELFVSGTKITISKPSSSSKYNNINFDSESDSDEETTIPIKQPAKITHTKPSAQTKSSIQTKPTKNIISKEEEKLIRESLNFDSSDSDSEEETVEPIEFETNLGDFKPDIKIYTDGACLDNGKSSAKAGIGIYFGKDDPRNISETIVGKQTNNIAEINALIRAYKIVESDILDGKNIAFFTDSNYSLLCLTSYGDKCAKDNWKKSIPNKDLVKEAYELFSYKTKPNIKLIHVKAHTGKQDENSLGNEQADLLANLAIGVVIKPKIYLKVPFDKKEFAKKLGCKWDSQAKKWFTNDETSKAVELFR